MKKDDLLYVFHIRDSVKKILEYMEGKSKEEFQKNSMLQDAVVRQLEIIGEASNRISIKIRNKYPDIPWKLIIGMRNRIIHEYFGIKYSIVWDTVHEDLPALEIHLEKIIRDLTPQSTLDL